MSLQNKLFRLLDESRRETHYMVFNIDQVTAIVIDDLRLRFPHLAETLLREANFIPMMNSQIGAAVSRWFEQHQMEPYDAPFIYATADEIVTTVNSVLTNRRVIIDLSK